MNFSKILGELASKPSMQQAQSAASKIPGGLAGGAVAGTLAALLVSSKSARKTAGTAAKYGGVALLGGLAYKAYQGWQADKASATQATSRSTAPAQQATPSGALTFEQESLAHANGEALPVKFQVALITAMIASARADGAIDAAEQAKISEAINSMAFDAKTKAELLNLFITPVSFNDFIDPSFSLEQKSELYLASCLAIELDDHREYAYLGNLSKALELPPELEQHLRQQSIQAA